MMETDNIVAVDGTSESLQAANDRAQATFKFFWRELSWEYRRIIPGLDVAVVKAAFPTNKKGWFRKAPESEVMWISQIGFDGKTISGVLQNDPRWIKGLKCDDPITLKLNDIADWLFAMKGHAYGGFTVNHIRRSMSPEERRQHDAAWGLDFGELTSVPLGPSTKMGEDGMLTCDYSLPVIDPSQYETTEHPMSINMRGKIEEQLDQQPDLVDSQDEMGWSLLHHEALAGNSVPVEILMSKGADPTAENHDGETALDLARRMHWPKVIDLLES